MRLTDWFGGFICGCIVTGAVLYIVDRTMFRDDDNDRPTRVELVRAGLAEWRVDEWGYVTFVMKVDVKTGGAK